MIETAGAARRWVQVAAVAAAAVPILVFAYRAVRDGAYPVFDDALIALRIHDVLSRHPPRVGAGTQFGLIAFEARANHPGPLPFVLLAPVYAASGHRPEGLVVALAAYHLAFVGLVAHLARRIGGTSLLVAAMGAVLVVERSLGDQVFTRPWNPYLALLPFLAFLFAAWAAVADRAPGALGWAVLTGSLAVQAQVTFAAAVGVVGVLATGVAVARAVRRRRQGRAASLRPLAVAGAVGLVAWAVPLHQQLTADDGNLGRLLRWGLGGSGSGSGEVVGVRRGVEMAAHVVGRGLPPTVELSAADGGVLAGPPPAVTWLGALVLVGALAACVVARGRVDRRAAVGAGLALVALAVGTAVAGRATPEAAASPYQVVSLWVTAAFALAVLAWAALGAALAVRPVATWRVPAVRATAAVGTVALLALAVGALRETDDWVLALQEDRYAPTVDATLAAVDPDDAPYLVSCQGSSRISLCGTLVLALEADGVATVADPAATSLYGPDVGWRLARPGDAHPTLVVASGPWLVPPTPDARLVVATLFDLVAPGPPEGPGTTTPAEREALDAATDTLVAADLRFTADDLAALRAARGHELVLGDDDGWFQGRTVAEWQALLDDEPARFVAAGGLHVLAEAGFLADRPDLAAHATTLAAFPDRDAVWLLPPQPARGARD